MGRKISRKKKEKKEKREREKEQEKEEKEEEEVRKIRKGGALVLFHCLGNYSIAEKNGNRRKRGI
jgi:hypothetical protein